MANLIGCFVLGAATAVLALAGIPLALMHLIDLSLWLMGAA